MAQITFTLIKNMSNAELLDSRIKPQPDHDGHDIQIAHIRTNHGISTVRSEQPGMESNYFFIGGLVSGGSYELAACSVAQLRRSAHTIRHGSNGFRGAIDADVEEVVDIVELFGQEGPVNLIGHSKAGRVALRAAARLHKDIDLESVTVINPALGATNMLEAAKGVRSILREQAAVNFAHPFRMARAARGAFHELQHRPLGIAGETLELLSPYDFSEDMKSIRGRGATTTLVIGEQDHIVPGISLEQEALRYDFDRIVRLRGAVDGGHFGVVVVKDLLMPVFLPHAAA